MFSLFAGLFNWLFSTSEINVLIIGFDNAGKTTLLEQLKTIYGSKKPGVPLDRIPPTIGLNLAKIMIQRCQVIIWDLGGQERLRSIWSKYYRESHGIIFLVDAADASRFEEVQVTLHELYRDPDLTGIPILVLANKQDLGSVAKSAEVLSNELKLDQLVKSSWECQGISALQRHGIEDAVESFIQTIKKGTVLKSTTRVKH